VRERQDLLDLLSSLSPEEWLAPSAAPGWTVKDLALHLLDDDLGWLSRGRDGDRSGLLDITHQESFVAALAAKNQRWVEGAQGFSLPVVTGLLRWAGAEMDAYYDTIDLRADGRVSWASDDPVPQWFDIAQDLTERWVHQMQMREAVGRVGTYRSDYLRPVLRTFVWALPHQFRVPAPARTRLNVDLGAGGRWSLAAQPSGAWVLTEGLADAPAAVARFSDDAGWKWLTGADLPAGSSSVEGPAAMTDALLAVRGILI
jgi:uncharacterized protein (TIGR03083 family)